MNATVYRHHVSRIAGTMLERACERLLDETSLHAEDFARMSDDELLAALRECPATADAAARLGTRDLYKRACWLELDAVPEHVVDADHADLRALERDVATEADLDPALVHLDVPGRPSMPESATRVVVDDDVRRLHEESPLVQGLQAAQDVQWRAGVYAPERHVDTVSDAAETTLGLGA
jgi:HD superfamily phosphohydrolase